MNSMFSIEYDEDVAVVTFSTPNSPMNVWAGSGVEELQGVVDELQSTRGCRAAVFLSGKEGNFHVGADLKSLASQTGAERAE